MIFRGLVDHWIQDMTPKSKQRFAEHGIAYLQEWGSTPLPNHQFYWIRFWNTEKARWTDASLIERKPKGKFTYVTVGKDLLRSGLFKGYTFRLKALKQKVEFCPVVEPGWIGVL
jgi:hypothetical protein